MTNFIRAWLQRRRWRRSNLALHRGTEAAFQAGALVLQKNGISPGLKEAVKMSIRNDRMRTELAIADPGIPIHPTQLMEKGTTALAIKPDATGKFEGD